MRGTYVLGPTPPHSTSVISDLRFRSRC